MTHPTLIVKKYFLQEVSRGLWDEQISALTADSLAREIKENYKSYILTNCKGTFVSDVMNQFLIDVNWNMLAASAIEMKVVR